MEIVIDHAALEAAVSKDRVIIRAMAELLELEQERDERNLDRGERIAAKRRVIGRLKQDRADINRQIYHLTKGIAAIEAEPDAHQSRSAKVHGKIRARRAWLTKVWTARTARSNRADLTEQIRREIRSLKTGANSTNITKEQQHEGSNVEEDRDLLGRDQDRQGNQEHQHGVQGQGPGHDAGPQGGHPPD